MINTILYFKSLRFFTKALKVFTWYLLFIFVIQIITIFLNRFKIPNLFLSHYYFIGQYFFISSCFYLMSLKLITKKFILYTSSLVFISLCIFYIRNPERYFAFNMFEIFLTSIPLIIFSLLFFIEKMDSVNKVFIYISSGFFTYLLCSTLLFATGDIASIDKITFWTINAFIYLGYQILIFVEWYKHFRKPEVIK